MDDVVWLGLGVLALIAAVLYGLYWAFNTLIAYFGVPANVIAAIMLLTMFTVGAGSSGRS